MKSIVAKYKMIGCPECDHEHYPDYDTWMDWGTFETDCPVCKTVLFVTVPEYGHFYSEVSTTTKEEFAELLEAESPSEITVTWAA